MPILQKCWPESDKAFEISRFNAVPEFIEGSKVGTLTEDTGQRYVFETLNIDAKKGTGKAAKIHRMA